MLICMGSPNEVCLTTSVCLLIFFFYFCQTHFAQESDQIRRILYELMDYVHYLHGCLNLVVL